MNVGQILETHLGWAALELGRKLEHELSNGVDAGAIAQAAARDLIPKRKTRNLSRRSPTPKC